MVCFEQIGLSQEARSNILQDKVSRLQGLSLVAE
jgi:hypothetical protein